MGRTKRLHGTLGNYRGVGFRITSIIVVTPDLFMSNVGGLQSTTQETVLRNFHFCLLRFISCDSSKLGLEKLFRTAQVPNDQKLTYQAKYRYSLPRYPS